MPPPNGQMPVYYAWEIEEIKDYYIKREKWYELAIIAGIVFAFLFGISI